MAKGAAISVMNKNVQTKNPAYSRADGVDVARRVNPVTTKGLKILEMNLNKLLVRQSEIIIKNKALKSDIDHQRRLRMQTNVAHAKFEGLLAKPGIDRIAFSRIGGHRGRERETCAGKGAP